MSLRKILFVGKLGAGKGTQAKLLIPYGFRHISTGDLIREAWKREDPLVMPHKSQIEAGHFLPDREIFGLIDRELATPGNEKGYVLDGAIRNIAQAETALQRGLVGEVLFFYLSEGEAIKRLHRRYEIEGRKDDDSSETTERRLMTYRKETRPVVDYLEENKILVYQIDAHPSIEEIHQKILGILGLK